MTLAGYEVSAGSGLFIFSQHLEDQILLFLGHYCAEESAASINATL